MFLQACRSPQHRMARFVRSGDNHRMKGKAGTLNLMAFIKGLVSN